MKRVKVNRFGFHCFEMFSVLNIPRNIRSWLRIMDKESKREEKEEKEEKEEG